MEGLRRPHNRVLWERLQQKHTLARPRKIGVTRKLLLGLKRAVSRGRGSVRDLARLTRQALNGSLVRRPAAARAR
jgi:hypothetical protein